MKINNGLKMIFSLYALCVFVACNVNVQKDDNKSTIKLESEMLNVELNETIAIDSLEIDAKRMGELSCLSRQKFDQWKQKEITREEMNKAIEPFNIEMAVINNRFEASYKPNKEKLDRFQSIFQEEFQKCSSK